jgi:hypothetical protein
MGTVINIAPSSDLTVGTTAVTSGTNGRVFFQAGGVVQQDANFTYDNTLKRLGLKAVGTAATDIPLSISNSAGTVNLLQQTGVGSILARSNDTFSFAGLFYRSDGTNGWSLTNSHSGYGQGTGIETVGVSNYILSSGTRALSIQRQSTGTFKTYGIWNYGSDAGQRLLIGENVFDPQFTLSGTGNVGIGTYSGAARLDVRAQGALSTDIAFRVRNSADTGNISEFRGNGVGVVCGLGTARAFFSPYNSHGGDGFMMTTQDLAVNGTPTKAAMFMTETYINMYGTSGVQSLSFAVDASYGGTTRQWQFSNLNLNDGALYLGTGNNATNNRRLFITDSATLNIGKDTMGNVNSGTNQLRILNGTAPSTLAADTFALYSADITAGNAAPHFRTENGAIVKVYQETTGVGASTLVTGLGIPLTDADTFDGYTLKQIVKALRNQGLLA